MANSPLWRSLSKAGAPLCPACAYPPSALAAELRSPVILTPSAREVEIDWRRGPMPRVRVLRLGPH